MSESDTLESHLARGTKYFNSAMFVLTDENGRARYYVNPGVDLTPYVKIVCSNTTGNSERAQQVFNRHKTGERSGNRKESTRTPKDHADYTLLNEAIPIIKDKFIDITDAMEAMKYGDYDEAKSILLKKSARNKQELHELLGQLDKYKEGKELATSTQTYRNVVEMLKNLKLSKQVKKNRTYYTLTTKYDQEITDTAGFEDRLTKAIQLWKIDGNQKWVQQLVKKNMSLIKKLLR
jgi:hypothetical protein